MVVSPELSDLLLRWYGCFPPGDMALTTDQFFSLQDGVFLIGTDPDEWGENLIKLTAPNKRRQT